MANARTFFSKPDDARIVAAIKAAETRTSGEIRVHLEDHADGGDPRARAAALFDELGMAATEARNGVLFYLAVKDRRFAVIGDAGIDAVVPEGFWDTVVAHLQAAFREGRFVDGLCAGIAEAGERLAEHFPHAGRDDRNELSDELSIG